MENLLNFKNIVEKEKSVPDVLVDKQAISTSSPSVWWGIIVEKEIVPNVPKDPTIQIKFEKLVVFFKKYCKKWCFQLEESDKGHLHYQCLGGFKKKIRKNQVIDLLADFLQVKRYCISTQKIANGWKFKEYCTKEDTRLMGPWGHDIPIPPKLLAIDDFYAWQRIIWNEVSQICTNDRVIHWIYDEKGCSGKTQLAKKICYEKGALLFSGKSGDISSRVILAPTPPKICLMNIARDMESFVSYKAIEDLKDGFVASGKYEGGQCIWDAPHVVIFANFYPRVDALTKDRWNIRTTDELSRDGFLIPAVQPLTLHKMFRVPLDAEKMFESRMKPKGPWVSPFAQQQPHARVPGNSRPVPTVTPVDPCDTIREVDPDIPSWGDAAFLARILEDDGIHD